MTRFIAAAGLFLLLSAGAMAAPFCLALTGTAPQCVYYDGATCARDAARQNGDCQTNPSEVRVPTSALGGYCMILSGGSSVCGYADGNICSRDARLQKGACVRSAGLSAQPIPNDYEPNANR